MNAWRRAQTDPFAGIARLGLRAGASLTTNNLIGRVGTAAHYMRR